MSFYLDHPFSFPAGVKHRPFQAKYERVDRQGQISHRIKSGAVYRDSSGRSRREFIQVMPETGMLKLIIDDPVGKRSYILDEEAKTAFALPLGDSGDEELQFRGEDIGHKVIEGLECRGYRMNLSDGSIMEYWVAEDLLEILYATYKHGAMESSVRHFEIQRDEPQANMFAVPSDYTEGDV